ncbi:glycosyltransferase [Methylobacterium komagatae]|uniref:Glycosyltransferase n=1 Tax=Methylobacterium komagatae TaxID=374425 RepID=A0ABW2BQZ7_9HYPH
MRRGPDVARALAERYAGEGAGLLLNSLESIPNDESKSQVAIASLLLSTLNAPIPEDVVIDAAYLEWIERHERPNQADISWMQGEISRWARHPLLSVLMPVFDPPVALLEEAVASLQAQIYENWELCIADDASRNPDVRTCIERLAAADARIRPVFRAENGHISEATNSAASIARGEFFVLMDNDDLLSSHALWTVAHYALANPDASMFYSDEDKLTPGKSRAQPYSKGAFDRFLLYGHNMFSHLGVFSRDIFEKVGGFRKGYEGSQDYDLILRCLDEAGEGSIVHIPHVLYQWRQIPGSTSMGASEKNYAFTAAKRAINDHFSRNDWPLLSVDGEFPGISRVQTLSTPNPQIVSVIIPTRDGFEHLSRCLESLRKFSDPLIEVVIVDNGTVDPKTLSLFASLERESYRYRVVRDDGDFNFSRLVNLGVEHARGAIVCLLNDDTEFLEAGAFERVRAWFSVSDIGIVGARLLYPDGTLQHFGVHLGVGEHRIAEHAYLGLPDDQHVNFSKSRLLQQFSAVTGACMFIRKADYASVGGFDESFPVAYNDIDFCLRVRAKGLKVICDPNIRLAHHESRTRGSDASPERRKRLDDDARRVLERWDSGGLHDPFYSPNFDRKHSCYRLSNDAPRAPWKVPLAPTR